MLFNSLQSQRNIIFSIFPLDNHGLKRGSVLHLLVVKITSVQLLYGDDSFSFLAITRNL